VVNEAKMEQLFFSACSHSFEYFIWWAYDAKTQINHTAFPEVRLIKVSIFMSVVSGPHCWVAGTVKFQKAMRQRIQASAWLL